MLGLVSALLFVGYLLVYAAAANKGALADRPWASLTVDAYTQSSGGGTSGSGSSSSPGGVVEQIIRRAGSLVIAGKGIIP